MEKMPYSKFNEHKQSQAVVSPRYRDKFVTIITCE